MCMKPSQLVVDLLALTSASYKACKASSRHFFGLEPNKEIFNALLKPLSSHSEELPLMIGHCKAQPWHTNKFGK